MHKPIAGIHPAASPSVAISAAVAQMQLPHEAIPSGVPNGYSWQCDPVIDAGNTPPSGFAAITGWGEVYLATGAKPVNRQVSFRNFRTYILTTADALTLVQSMDSVVGALFNPDYQGNVNVPAVVASSKGVTTVTAEAAYAFQFWPPNKASIDPATLAGVIVVTEAMIAADGPVSNDDYVLALGADYWVAVDSVYGDGKNNVGVATGRFCYLTDSWQSFTMTTISPAQCASLPHLVFPD